MRNGIRLAVLILVSGIVWAGGTRSAHAGLLTGNGSYRVFLPLIVNGALSTPTPTPTVVPTSNQPPTDESYYVSTTDPSTAYDLGCKQGEADASVSPPANSLVVLDFGGQLADGSGTLLIDGVSISNAQIEAVAEAFAHGYWYCTGTADTTSVLTLALGTNNSNDDVNAAGGQVWAQVVAAVAAADRTQGYNAQVVVEGANDLEPDWMDVADSEAWVNGYAAAASALYVDFGSADGCPTDSSANAACSNGWTQNDVWYVSWGASAARPLPEIYYDANAWQWEMIALYSVEYQGSRGRISFLGPLDTYPLWSSTNSPAQAWQEFCAALNSQPATVQTMPYSVEITSE